MFPPFFARDFSLDGRNTFHAHCATPTVLISLFKRKTRKGAKNMMWKHQATICNIFVVMEINGSKYENKNSLHA